MCYREKWVEDTLAGRSLLSCALDVHMTAMGSQGRDQDSQNMDVNVLVNAISNWRVGHDRSKRFDDAVKELILAAISEEHREALDRIRQKLRGSHAV